MVWNRLNPIRNVIGVLGCATGWPDRNIQILSNLGAVEIRELALEPIVTADGTDGSGTDYTCVTHKYTSVLDALYDIFTDEAWLACRETERLAVVAIRTAYILTDTVCSTDDKDSRSQSPER